jgi:hypothetical protein
MWELIVAIVKLLYSFVVLIGNALLIIPQMIIALFPAWLKLGGSDLIASKIIATLLIALLCGAGIYVGRRTERQIISLVSAIVGALSLLITLSGTA